MIPPSLEKFFWDTGFSKLDLKKNEQTIVSRVLNYGALVDWRWLAETYGKARVAHILQTKSSIQSRTNIREPARRLAMVLFA
jgi:hypothetical protein